MNHVETCSGLEKELVYFYEQVTNFEAQEDKHPSGSRTNELNTEVLYRGKHILQNHMNELLPERAAEIQMITACAQRYFNRSC